MKTEERENQGGINLEIAAFMIKKNAFFGLHARRVEVILARMNRA